MAEKIRDVMTTDPRTVDSGSTVTEAARVMREADIGPVIVTEGDGVRGIVTDRDIAVRAVADGRDPNRTEVQEIVSEQLETLGPDDSIDDAVEAMRQSNIRRLPIVEDGTPIGIVSLGDLAVERDPDSALADISAAPPNE